MKQIILAVVLGLAFAAARPAPMAAQTRVSVALGFGVPAPYVSGVVVVGRPYVYYPAPVVVVPAPRRYAYYRAPLVVVRRGYIVRHHHRHFDRDWDDDD